MVGALIKIQVSRTQVYSHWVESLLGAVHLEVTEKMKRKHKIQIAAAAIVLVAPVVVAVFRIGGAFEDLSNTQERVTKLEEGSSIEEAKDQAIGEMREMINSMRQDNSPTDLRRIIVPGGGPWGKWQGEIKCPDNYFVCGLEQKVESRQGGDGDDTALNAIRMICCPLPDTSN